MDLPERRQPPGVDVVLQQVVPLWAGPLARIVAIAMLPSDISGSGPPVRRYRITTRIGLDEPRQWLALARWASADERRELAGAHPEPAVLPMLIGEPDGDGNTWVALPDNGTSQEP